MNFFASAPGFLRAQFKRQLIPGAVIKLAEKMDDGKVQEKRFVVVNVTDKVFCCVINSQINQFIQNKANLLRCQVSMSKANHPFMSWDSYVDCIHTKAYAADHVLDELVNKRGWMLGNITLEVRDDIVSALKFSPALSPKDVAELCAALGAMV